jgi:hypothetical protein
MGDDVHMRLEPDIGGHGRADAVGAACDGGAAMDFVDLHDRSIGMVERCGRFDILRVEGPRQPEI